MCGGSGKEIAIIRLTIRTEVWQFLALTSRTAPPTIFGAGGKMVVDI
jgi:hypothetical protein